MGAPIDRYNALVQQMKAAFEQACVDIPLCRRRIEETFDRMRSMHDSGDTADLQELADLAEDLGLDISFSLRVKPL